MAGKASRPLSPHLTIWKWGPHMAVSILTRVTGVGLATLGVAVLIWWLLALAGGEESYATFTGWANHWLGVVIGIGLSWAFFQHLLSGLRHFVMDAGAGFELKTNRFWSLMTLAGGIVLTIILWAWILLGRAA